MRNSTRFFFLIIALLGHTCLQKAHTQQTEISLHEHAVTYETPGGRLGDQLIAYMHAKWISYLYNIPLLYKPFPHSSDLVLDDVELSCACHSKSFQHVLKIENLDTIRKNTLAHVLFITQYFPESSYELKLAKWPYFAIDWQDEHFLSLLRSLIYPKSPFPQPDLPKDKVTIAVHIRRGGGFDDAVSQLHWPLKFPPDSFFIAQIRKIYELLKKPLFVHIFTDDPFPDLIAENYRHALSDIDVIFDHRSDDNNYQNHVLADLFDMMRYTCLIRPESNFSIVAEKLGLFKIVINPTQYILNGKKISITAVNCTIFN